MSDLKTSGTQEERLNYYATKVSCGAKYECDKSILGIFFALIKYLD